MGWLPGTRAVLRSTGSIPAPLPVRGETGPPHREPASNEVISTDGASYCTIAYRRMTKVFQSEPHALKEHSEWTRIRPSFRGMSAGVEGCGYPVQNFGPFRASEQLVAIARRAGEARDLPNLRQGAKQRRKALRTVGAGVGATEGENWLPISRKRHQIGH